MTQAALAEAAGLTRPRLNLIERGSANPSMNSVLRLAQALGMQLLMEPESRRPTLAATSRTAEERRMSERIDRLSLHMPHAVQGEVTIVPIAGNEQWTFTYQATASEDAALTMPRNQPSYVWNGVSPQYPAG